MTAEKGLVMNSEDNILKNIPSPEGDYAATRKWQFLQELFYKTIDPKYFPPEVSCILNTWHRHRYVGSLYDTFEELLTEILPMIKSHISKSEPDGMEDLLLEIKWLEQVLLLPHSTFNEIWYFARHSGTY